MKVIKAQCGRSFILFAPELGILYRVLGHLEFEVKDQTTLCSLSLLFAALRGPFPVWEIQNVAAFLNFTVGHSQLHLAIVSWVGIPFSLPKSKVSLP